MRLRFGGSAALFTYALCMLRWVISVTRIVRGILSSITIPLSHPFLSKSTSIFPGSFRKSTVRFPLASPLYPHCSMLRYRSARGRHSAGPAVDKIHRAEMNFMHRAREPVHVDGPRCDAGDDRIGHSLGSRDLCQNKATDYTVRTGNATPGAWVGFSMLASLHVVLEGILVFCILLDACVDDTAHEQFLIEMVVL